MAQESGSIASNPSFSSLANSQNLEEIHDCNIQTVACEWDNFVSQETFGTARDVFNCYNCGGRKVLLAFSV